MPTITITYHQLLQMTITALKSSSLCCINVGSMPNSEVVGDLICLSSQSVSNDSSPASFFVAVYLLLSEKKLREEMRFGVGNRDRVQV